jgi:outer membrane protein OmpA-like peptidoglycan-associated protein
MSFPSRSFRAVTVGLPLALAATLAAPSASAQATGFTANRYEPAESGSDWFENDSLDLRGKVRPAFGLTLEYAKDNVDLIAGDGSIQQRLVADQLFLHLGASLVLVDRIRLGLSLPLALYQMGFSGGAGTPNPPSKAAVGDLRAGADLRLLGEYGDPFQLALGGQVWVPTGPVSQYTGDGVARGEPHLLIAGDLLDFAYAVHFGYEVRGLKGTFQGTQFGNELAAGIALGLRIADKKLLLGPELNTWTLATDAFKSQTSPTEILLGGHYRQGDWKFGAGIGVGFQQAFGSPGFRAILGVDWTPAMEKAQPVTNDRDGDGIPDAEDACPDTPGVRTDDPKTNGCPMPTPPLPPDNDKDGVYDMDDACPETAGIKTEDPKTNGCPGDRDHDGIPDNEDACPDVPGVKTADPKTNGCPPPDPDRDHDGIPNDVDACPDEPGPPNTDPKKNGCPLAFVSQGQIKITEQVKFEVASARILKDSDKLMNAVLGILNAHPEIKLVRVEGHTDNTGAAAYNKTLSGQRAAAVAAWLTLHGIDKTRLASEGFGAERPIDTNATVEGKANNRRVEFHIDKTDAAPAPGAAAPGASPPAAPPAAPPPAAKP